MKSLLSWEPEEPGKEQAMMDQDLSNLLSERGAEKEKPEEGLQHTQSGGPRVSEQELEADTVGHDVRGHWSPQRIPSHSPIHT